MKVMDGSDDGFRLTSEQEEELLAALQDVENGDYEDGGALLQELSELTGR